MSRTSARKDATMDRRKKRSAAKKASNQGRERPHSEKILIFDPTGGLSGDMILGSLFALGARPAEVAAEVSELPELERFRIVFGRVKRHGIAAVRARVVCPHHAHARDLKRILSMIRRSRLSKKAKELAEKTFLILGEAEGRIHGVPLDKVHFHEVGAVDSIVDIVGTVVALEKLGYPKLYHRPFTLGSGMIDIAHGKLPAPAPATLEVLRGRTVRMSEQEG
ncbi:MAG TPA: nickel insertion protein, partial [Candidatus Krumholzibacterium sp.]|nr:nickel insertion protein [Candidatus Krumholzibacterium sp.]